MLNAKGQTNCPNCGAPISAEKCPYCGTVFYDFSTIETGQPTYIKIRHEGAVVMCKAILKTAKFDIRNEFSEYTTLGSINKDRVAVSQAADVNMEFSVISDECGRLFTAVEV